jgi:hypothetical protein
VTEARRRGQEYCWSVAFSGGCRLAASSTRSGRSSLTIVRERRQGDGRWLLDVRRRDTPCEEIAGEVGEPNRWVTLRARRVLDWDTARKDS